MRPFILILALICAFATAQESRPNQDMKQQQATAGLSSAVKDNLPSKEEVARQAIENGWLELEKGNAGNAVRIFNRAATLNPFDANAYWGMGAATVQQHKFAIAVQLLERAAALDPTNVRIAADAGLAYTRGATNSTSDMPDRGNSVQKALAWFDKAEKLDPAYALTYANRAVALAYLGDYDKAWENIFRAEAIDKDSLDPKLISYLSEKRARPEKPLAKNAQTAQAADRPPIAVTQTETPAPAATEPEPPEMENDAEAADNAPKAEETLRVIGTPSRYKGPDKRQCLEKSTNEEIIRCVYPRR